MSEVKVGSRPVGYGHAPFVIAEVGINHNGDVERACEMVHAAQRAGADAVKFQTFRADELVGDPALTYTYISQGWQVTESMRSMFARVELPRAGWERVAATARDAGIVFLSTPQNRSDLDLLLELGITAIKVGSDDFTNLPLLRSYASSGLPLILSCGMADLAEVHRSLETVGAFDGYPTVLLLCTSQYPTPPADVHLRKLDTLCAAFPDVVLGFSDHTRGATAAAIAVAKGASVFEKHFTLSHDLPGPDHWFSEEPDALAAWVTTIREAHTMLGDPRVRPTAVELAQRSAFRRVLVAATEIAAGTILAAEHFVARRIEGGAGIPPALSDLLVGRAAARNYERGEPITL